MARYFHETFAQLRLAAISVVALTAVFAASEADAAKRNALIIGNAKYNREYALRNPVADARAIARSFSALGYQVTLVQNSDLATTQRALDAFVPAAKAGDVSVIYYAGHGAMLDRRTFILPVDFNMNFENVDKEALDVERVIQALMSTHAGLKILMFDACQNNPLENRGAVSLKEEEAPPPREDLNVYLAWATAQGETASDGSGDHSPFAEGVLTNIVHQDLELKDMMDRVADFVFDNTDGRQNVWEEETLRTAFFLGKPSGETGAITEFVPPPPDTAGLVFANSDTALLTEADLKGKDAATLRLARNEIFARRGKIFTDAALTEHFSKFGWYTPMVEEPKLNEIEATNIELIRQYELLVAAPTDGFIFPDSDRRLLESSEVSPLDKEQLRMARNEIYARRGRKFVRKDVREYFEQFDWYDPRFGEVELTYIEAKNVELIQSFEK